MEQLKEITGKAVVVPTGNEMINKFFGNEGVVQGALYFIYGPAGSSKSTFLQWLMKLVSTNPNNVPAFFSNEQNAIAIKENCARIKMEGDFAIESEKKDLNDIMQACLELKAANPGKQLWIVVDALQGVTDAKNHPRKHGIEAHVINTLREFAAKNQIIAFLIGHVNKKGQYAGPTTINHNIDVELTITNDSKFVRSVYVKKNRWGASGNSIRLNLANNSFEIMPEKSIMELDFSSKEDQALMPKMMRLMKENSIAGKIAQETMNQGKNVIRKAIVDGIKHAFRKATKRK